MEKNRLFIVEVLALTLVAGFVVYNITPMNRQAFTN
jgi:hypothetical protein